jgi:hypothetical protein
MASRFERDAAVFLKSITDLQSCMRIYNLSISQDAAIRLDRTKEVDSSGDKLMILVTGPFK